MPAFYPQLEYLGGASSNSFTSSFSFTDRNLGEPDQNRYIVCCVSFGGANSEATSCTIAGVSASLVVGNTTLVRSRIFIAAVPTGTAGTVSVSRSSSVNGAGIHLYRLTLLNPSAVDTKSTVDGVTLIVPEAGIGIGCICNYNGAAPPSFTEGLVDDGIVTWFSVGNYDFVSGSTRQAGNVSIDITPAAAPGVCVSWGL